MSDKQAMIEALSKLPESANYVQLLRAMYDDAVRRGAEAVAAALHKSLFPAPTPAEYLNPKCDMTLQEILDVLDAETRPDIFDE